jgi:hypothetical protein
MYHFVVYTSMWYLVFSESQAFTRRLHELAENASDSVLANLQSALLDNPARGDMVKALEESGRRVFRIRAAVRESAAAFVTCTCFWNAEAIFTCSSFSTRTSRKT